MLYKNLLARSVKFALIGGAATAALSAPVFAAEEEGNVERVEVTGSRIYREGVESPSPVTVISGKDLVNSGALNIGEVLNELPALATTYSLANSGRFIGTAGLNILDLRNMGTDRTLVLVDGKRHVSSAAGSASVDTNTIPSVWIDRVEIITGGASAVYGADAVTGVVNFILKDNIEGLDVSFTRGDAADNPYANGKYTFSYGTNFDEDKGNIAFAVEYAEQDQLWASDRDITNVSIRSLANPAQNADNKDDPNFPDKITYENAGLWSITNAGTVYGGAGVGYTFDPDGSFRSQNLGSQIDGISCLNCEYLNLRDFTELQPEFDRVSFNLKGQHEYAEDHEVYFSGKYVKVEAKDEGQASFFHFDGRNSIKRDNPFVHSTLADFMDENELSSIRINRMNTDFGVRIEEDERITKRFVLGAKGYMNEDWGYDVSYVWGATDHIRTNLNNLVYENYFNALDAVRDANGDIVCRDEDARAAGCVPINIMGYGAPSQAAANYVNTTSVGSSRVEQNVFSASISNSSLYELPAGDIGLAAGVEYREEKSVTKEPSNATEGATFFNSLGEDEGSFNVKEAFVEISVPLLADMPAVEMLNLDTAVRFADYSSVGNATSWKVGLDWQVGFGLKFRSTYSEALRAPNIGELFGAESETFYNIDDACKTSELDDLQNAETRRANCAALGVPVGFDSDYDAASVRGLQTGNLELKEEKSESLTIGAVYSPEFIDDASITIDYWKIELTDAISAVGSQDIVDRCVDSETGIDNIYCSRITRDSSGEITLIRNSVLNLAGQEASGIDFEIAHSFDLMGGDFSANLLGTYLIERKTYAFQEDPSDFTENAGTTGEAKWQANLSLAYSKDSWVGTWKTRYIDRVSLYTEQELEDNPNPNNLLEFPSYFVTDVTAGYNFDSGVSFRVGIDNLFDKDLPFGTTGTGAGSASYDGIGRFYYATISYSM
ncbi:TonB-dependent receptor [Shewanella sp. 202IG2-18]|uniref:TonB-dependent receptor domain-containing protein n=1 Tax=Parashewanella hymeniacidonis TaxID=2807618 RepID=UPI00195FBF94|nr:TonB-dependent receptor [Parashewanella hymeniacidonis]MBM7071269.1 TonB-dependent receptor [Parashewanella hymeniacidonis]